MGRDSGVSGEHLAWDPDGEGSMLCARTKTSCSQPVARCGHSQATCYNSGAFKVRMPLIYLYHWTQAATAGARHATRCPAATVRPIGKWQEIPCTALVCVKKRNCVDRTRVESRVVQEDVCWTVSQLRPRAIYWLCTKPPSGASVNPTLNAERVTPQGRDHSRR